MRITVDPLNLANSRSAWSIKRWDAVANSTLAITFDDAVFQLASGEGSGFIEYGFDAPGADDAALTVTARLSSEYTYSRTAKPSPSDVIVSINGVEIGRERVIADNARGQLYRWVVAAGRVAALKLKPTGNAIRFTVPESATFANGLSVYSDRIGNADIAVLPITAPERLPVVIESAENGAPAFSPPATDAPFDLGACAQYRTLTNADGNPDDYVVFVPPGLEPGGSAGLIVYFHSMWGHGDTVALSSLPALALRRNMILLGITRRLKQDEKPYPYVPLPVYFNAAEQAIARIRSEYVIDPRRIYTLGSSMGGGPSLQFAATHDYVQAAAVIHGVEMDKSYREQLAAVPVLIFHGTDDEPVPVSVTTELADALKALHGTIATVIKPKIRHEWRYLFDSAATMRFYAEHQRRQTAKSPAR